MNPRHIRRKLPKHVFKIAMCSQLVFKNTLCFGREHLSVLNKIPRCQIGKLYRQVLTMSLNIFNGVFLRRPITFYTVNAENGRVF